MLTKAPFLRVCLLGTVIASFFTVTFASQKTHGCPEGVEPLIRTLYNENVRTNFWGENISTHSHLFEDDLLEKLLTVSKEARRRRSAGLMLIDIDIFSGTQWGTDQIKTLKCNAVDNNEVQVKLVILSGGEYRQFEHSVVAFARRDTLKQNRWRVFDLGAYEDASLERGYGYLLSETLASWLNDAEDSR